MKFKGRWKQGLFLLVTACASTVVQAQDVNVDVNLNIKHSVGDKSDFGRKRHITMHMSLDEPDWNGEDDKLDYLMNDLDVYFGRDNGASTFHFNYAAQDPSRPNYALLDSVAIRGEFYKGEYDKLDRVQKYEDRTAEMILGTNPHPLYPTLSWNTDGLNVNKWQTKDVDASAEWVVEYLDQFFAKSEGESGQPIPKYWEVINEPDMEMMTGAFMVTSQEKLWEYHNLVAKGLKERLGAKAPLVGGMTWGQHDFYLPDGLGRFAPGYLDVYLTDEQKPVFANMSKTSIPYESRGNDWYQWDVIWKGFMEAAGENMDFYSVHIYDWPLWEAEGKAKSIRAGNHTEAMLDMMEWYDLETTGKRKPIVLSEYGAVSDYIKMPGLDPDRRDWENLKPFSSMLMQFLERPDYIVKTMPFTPLKASWGDLRNAQGEITSRYPYKMLDQDASGDWQWTQFIKWYELWADVEGTRIDTKASDRDIQVDAYIDGDVTYLILNNLESNEKELKLNFFGGDITDIASVRMKHLFLNGNMPTLSDEVLTAAPATVTLGAEATMILAYKHNSPVSIDETSKEFKYMGEPLTSSEPYRVTVSESTMTAQVNGVSVPQKGEAMLRLCGKFFWEHITREDDRNEVTINGFPLEIDTDWRGEYRPESQIQVMFGVLEIPVPIEYLSTNNIITSKFLNENTYTNVSLQVWDMSVEPGRSDKPSVPDGPDMVDATGVNVSPAANSVQQGAVKQLMASVLPANASNKTVTWSSNNTAIATVNATGLVRGISPGAAVITVTSVDGAFTAEATVQVLSVPTGNSLVIQAEDFSDTGGAFGGFETYTTGGVEAINFNQNGDWGEYIVNITEGGEYQIDYFLGTAVDGAAIEFVLDGTTIMTDNVPNNGDWDDFGSLVASQTVSLTAGTHTIRLVGAGSSAWAWNMDKIVLTLMDNSSSSKLSDEELAIKNEVKIYPNPAGEVLHFFNAEAYHSVRMYNTVGMKIVDQAIEASGLDVSGLLEGMYMLELVGDDAKQVKRVFIQH